MDTGTCSLRRVFRNGSCSNCPLLLMATPESYYLKVYCKWFCGKCQCTKGAALKRIAELGAREPRARRGLLRHGGDEGAGESRGGQLGHCGLVGGTHRIDE